MRVPIKALVVLTSVIILFAGGLLASNMGFKIVYPLKAQAAGVSISGFNTLGLPYVRREGIDTARTLLINIGITNVAEIDRYNRAANQYDVYSLANPVDYPLVASEGYFVKMAQDLDYHIVGSHDPGAVIHLIGQGESSVSGQNLIALPYHATAGTARELLMELGYLNVAEIDRYNRAANQYDIYSLANPVDYPLVAGEAYFVKAIHDFDFVPSHY